MDCTAPLPKLSSQAAAAVTDWPQILGPNRDGQATLARRIGSAWQSPLPVRWRVALGSGYGGAAVIGNQVLTLHRQEDQEMLQSVSLVDGSLQWQAAWPARYRGRINPDEGPRCVPVIHDGRAFCFGAAGELVCVDIGSGQILWRRDLHQEYQADAGYFGAGSTPLAIDGMLIVCLGGKQAGVIAVEQKTGKTLWTATDYEASYASPIAIRTADSSLVLAVMRLNCVLLNAADGKLLSQIKFGSRGPTVNAATPIPIGDDRYFLTASYGVGSLTLQLQPGQGLIEQQRGTVLSSQYNTPVRIGQQIIGIDGREDVGMASLKSVDSQTQQVIWEKTEFGTAHLLAIGNQCLALSTSGELTLFDGGQAEFRQLAVSQLPSGTYRALPAMAGTQLILRRSTSATRSELLCIELP